MLAVIAAYRSEGDLLRGMHLGGDLHQCTVGLEEFVKVTAALECLIVEEGDSYVDLLDGGKFTPGGLAEVL